MGFSVSTSMAIVFLGTLVAFGGIYTATSNTVEQVQTTTDAEDERLYSTQKTAINVTTTELLGSDDGCGIDVTVTNNGSTTLSVAETDILVDGVYQTGWADAATVDGDGDTDIWLPGQALSVQLTAGIDTAPTRVKVVTGSGVAATAFPTGDVSC
jgi:flagellar protein FlaF